MPKTDPERREVSITANYCLILTTSPYLPIMFCTVSSQNNTKPFQNTSKIKQEQKRAIRWIALLVYITLDKQRKFKAIKNKRLLSDTELRKYII